MERPESLKSLQAYRGIAAVLVMLFHANIIFSDQRYFGFAPAPIFLAGAAGVPFFFVLSGYIIARSHDFSKNGIKQAWNFLLKRGLRLYPLLWIVLLAVIPANYVMTHHVPTLGYLFCSFFALPMPALTPLAVEWTLQHEVLFYVTYAVLLALPIVRIPVLALLAASSILGVFLVQAPYWWMFIGDPSHALFVLGVVLIVLRHEVSSRAALWLLAGGVILFSGTYAVALANQITSLPYGVEWPYGIASATIIYTSIILERSGKLQFPAWAVKLGDASYVLYLVHFPLLSIALHVLHPLATRQHMPVIVGYALSIAFASLVSLVLHELLERRLLGPFAKNVYQRFGFQVAGAALRST